MSMYLSKAIYIDQIRYYIYEESLYHLFIPISFQCYAPPTARSAIVDLVDSDVHFYGHMP